jgi:protein-tyrosine phosphatase
MSDINNRWIFMPDTVLVNVSPKYKPEIVDGINGRGIDYYHFPLEEGVPDIGWANIQQAVAVLLRYDATGKHMLVHCDYGNHRSRLVVEAFHYVKYGTHFMDEYKGFYNHLIYDCSSGGY